MESDQSFTSRVLRATGFAPWEIPLTKVGDDGFYPACWDGTGAIIARRSLSRGRQEIVFARENEYGDVLYARVITVPVVCATCSHPHIEDMLCYEMGTQPVWVGEFPESTCLCEGRHWKPC